MTLGEMTALALAHNYDKAVIVDGFPHDEDGLDIPLNPHIEGDKEMLAVARLSLKDSGVGPLLWRIAIEHLKAARSASS